MTTTSKKDVRQALTPFEFNGKKASWLSLSKLLPDVDTALFFARAVKMDYAKVGELLQGLFKTSVLDALQRGDHSETLQDYIVDMLPPSVEHVARSINFVPDSGHGEILPHMWEAIEIGVADSIGEVAAKLSTVLDSLPGKAGVMSFQHMMQLNRRRPTIGDYKATIKHPLRSKNLVILDDSGSMSASTISAIAGDVVALGMKAEATLALVSNTTRVWEPGTYSLKDVLAAGQYGGTQYETLAPLLNQEWGVVVTIADYDSSRDAQRYLAENAKAARIEKLLDISLVSRPTFLAECIGQFAKEMEPLLVARNDRVLLRGGY